MKESYGKGLELDRINNNGNYEPSNCRWVSAKENCRNKRNSRIINTPLGEMPLWKAEEVSGIRRTTLLYRHAMGVPPEEMFCPPDKKKSAAGKKRSTT
jgi:hypothetical protein